MFDGGLFLQPQQQPTELDAAKVTGPLTDVIIMNHVNCGESGCVFKRQSIIVIDV